MMKIRHLGIALAALLIIAFMPPLVSLLGGLTLLIGAGALIFRDLPPAGQDAVERRVLGWLRRVRADAAVQPEADVVLRPLPTARPRRVRARIPVAERVDVPPE